jgi:hypothetical protein
VAWRRAPINWRRYRRFRTRCSPGDETARLLEAAERENSGLPAGKR